MKSSWKLGSIKSVLRTELSEVRFDFVVESRAAGAMTVRRKRDGEQVCGRSGSAALFAQHSAMEVRHSNVSSQEPRVGIPRGAAEHMRETAATGRPHRTTPKDLHSRVDYILDLPFPLPFYARAHRCQHCCRDRATEEDNLPLSAFVDDGYDDDSLHVGADVTFAVDEVGDASFVDSFDEKYFVSYAMQSPFRQTP